MGALVAHLGWPAAAACLNPNLPPADRPPMESQGPRRLILSYAREDAYVPLTRAILSKMGYSILNEEEWRSLREADHAARPDLRIIDERRMDELEAAGDGVPTIALTGRQGVDGGDPRFIGAVRRPAGLHELFRLIQLALEDVPRATPRVPTYLPATCRADSREWNASVLSLSENGCLLRSPEPLHLGSEVDLSFELPQVGTIQTHAETSYQLVPDLGLVFADTSAEHRRAIASFVEQTLAEL